MNWEIITTWGNKAVNKTFFYLGVMIFTWVGGLPLTYANNEEESPTEINEFQRNKSENESFTEQYFPYNKELLHQGQENLSSIQTGEFESDVSYSRQPSSAKKLQKTKIKRDRRFKVPDSKITSPKKRRKRLNLRDIRPPMTRKLYYKHGSDEAELEEVYNEEIKQLFKLLKNNKSADLILRLGSLYVEKSRHIAHKIQTDYEKHMQEFKAGRRKTKPYLNLKPAQAYNKKSLKIFQNFKVSYPRHKRMDEVLFFLGFNFYQIGNEAESINYFSKLESRFPKSPYLYEAYFQLGEHYFQLSQWKKSFESYKKMVKNKRGKFYFLALYKMAWSAYKMDKMEMGLSFLERIIRESKRRASDAQQVFSFKKEAEQDLVLFYTYSKKSPKQAKNFFLSLLDNKTAWESLRKLAYAYRDSDQTKAVLVLFNDLIQYNPTGKDAFEYKYQIVETVYSFGTIAEIAKHLKGWVRNYGPNSSWQQAHRKDDALVKKSLRLQEVTIRNYALKNHETFRRTKRERGKILSLNCYNIYFNYFARSPFADQMYFFYGELLFDSQRYAAAFKPYETLIVNFPKSKYTKPAFINQMLVLERTLPSDKAIEKFIGKNEKPVTFTKPVANFVKAAKRYTERFPKEKNTPSIIYKVAAFYYKFNQFPMSARYFEKLFDEYPRSKLVNNVGSILLDIYNRNKDYKSLENLARKLARNKIVNQALLKEVKSILEQLSFKKAQDLALNKNYKESATLYHKFAKAHPHSALTPSAFYNSGLNFEKSGDRLSAISMYSSVLKYQGQKHQSIRKKSQEFLAVLYEKLGFYRKAANAYVAFAKNYPKNSKASDFWYNSGVIFDALNDITSSVHSYQQHFALSKKSDRYEIFYLIGVMYERNRNWQKAIDYYKQYLGSPSSNKFSLMKASFTIADLYNKKLHSPENAKIWHQKTLNLYRRLNQGVSYGARSHFYITKALYKKFSQAKIPVSQKEQAKAVARKIQLLKNLESALRPIIRYNDGEQIIASLALMGQANQEMAKAIYYAPIPKGLNKQGRIQYKESIKKIIDPYIKEAVKSYQLALTKSENLEIYTDWAKVAYKGLHSIELSNGVFQKFVPAPLELEFLPLQIKDDTGKLTTDRILKTLKGFLKHGISKADFENLSQAIAQKQEHRVLKAVSVILNKDPDNALAINSLALFYLNNNKPRLGTLILNRISTKDLKNPIVMNNLAITALKKGNTREAITNLKKALSVKASYPIAQANLANILAQQYNYKRAYEHFKRSYSSIIKRLAPQDRRRIALLNNYAVTLTLTKKWSAGEPIFKKITRDPPVKFEILLNYACFLVEKK